MIQFIGDVFLDKQYKVDFELNNFILNLEFPLSKKGEPAKLKANLGVEKSFIFETFQKKPLAVNLANNHIMDYGEEAFQDTISYLNEKNIKYFGAGNQENNFNNPLVLDMCNKKIAFLGYCCKSTSPIFGDNKSNGSAPLELSLIKEDIEKVKGQVDKIVVNLHWGDEEISYPKPSDIKKARDIIDMGVDLIIGHHAHVIQTVEGYKGKHIFYGLGNFLFPNLNVPALYDGKNFQRTYKKIQNKKNKRSIVVSISENFEVNYKTTYFNGEVVKYKKSNIPKWLPKTDKGYRNYYKLWGKQRMLELYIKNPRIPSVYQIKLFLGLNK